MENKERKIKAAKYLLKEKAVFLRPNEPFTWASGIQSPVYCDNRLLLSSPEARSFIEKSLSEIIGEKYPDCDILMGTSTAGIPHAAICAHLLGKPMGYVRSSAKSHGRQNKIEGRLEKGAKALIIEDLISTGGSAIDAAIAVREAGAEVLGVLSIFTYNMKKGFENFAAEGLEYVSLTDYDTLVEAAAEENYIPAESIKALLCFRDNPNDDAWMKLLSK